VIRISCAVAEPDHKSLLSGAGVQGELIPLENLPDDIFLEEESPSGFATGRYTAERFFSKRPEDYKLCVSLLAGGLGLLHCARLLKVHHMTVAAVRDREGDQIDIQKERIRKNIRLAVGIGSERLPDIMANLAAGQVPLSMAILLDKLAQLDGEPTQRIEVVHKGHLTHEAIAASVNQFPEAIDIESSVPPTGSLARPTDQKALPGPSLPDIKSGDTAT
jgi:hypothetical protein